MFKTKKNLLRYPSTKLLLKRQSFSTQIIINSFKLSCQIDMMLDIIGKPIVAIPTDYKYQNLTYVK